MKKLLYILFVLPLLTNCGESVDPDDPGITYMDTSDVSSDLVFDENDYELDWINFQEAIANNDTSAVDAFNETNTETSLIMTLCSEDWVKEQLANTAYEYVMETDYDGELLREFAADDITEIDGVEYGSSVYLYFKETARGLKLVDYMAAG